MDTQNKEFSSLFKNVCEDLANIYTFLHKNGEDTDELDKRVSELYNLLNRLENRYTE